MLHETSSRSAQAWAVLNWITQSYLPPTRFIPARAEPLPGNLHPQSSTAVTHCLLIAKHFTNPRKDDSLCQARQCHQELNPGRWRQRRVCYHTATCSLCNTEGPATFIVAGVGAEGRGLEWVKAFFRKHNFSVAPFVKSYGQ